MVESVDFTLIGKYFRKSTCMRISRAYKDGIAYGAEEFLKEFKRRVEEFVVVEYGLQKTFSAINIRVRVHVPAKSTTND